MNTTASDTSVFAENYGTSLPSPAALCGSSRECDPAGDKPCCDLYIWDAQYSWTANHKCGNTSDKCNCEDCVDFRVVRDLRASDTNCTITRVGDFLKTVCSDVGNKTKYYFKCIESNVSYKMEEDMSGRIMVSKVCDKDNLAYQSCVSRLDISKNYKTGDVLCDGYYCVDKDNKTQFINCDKNCRASKVCPEDIESHTCDHKCDDEWYCSDELDCNGYTYGLNCLYRGGSRYVPVDWICDVMYSCTNGEDERDCEVMNSTIPTCSHAREGHKVPIGEEPMRKNGEKWGKMGKKFMGNLGQVE